VLEAPRQRSNPETGGYGLLRYAVPVLAWDRLVRLVPVRAGEVAFGVAVERDEASGVELGADPADRHVVNVGSVPAVPAELLGLGQAHRPLMPPGRGGGPVVVRAGESPVHGEGVQ
jgi:hypothetical protein